MDILDLLNTAETYLAQNQPELALPRLEDALASATAHEAKPELARCHLALAEAYKQLGDFEAALRHYEQFHRFDETLREEEASHSQQHRTANIQEEESAYRQRNTALEREITRRKALEGELRKLFLAAEQSANTIVITDTEGHIEYVNPQFTQLSGYSRDEVIGQNPRILQSGRTPRKVYEELWATVTAGKIWRGEFLNKKKNGELYWEAASISPVRDADGNITHFLAIKEDITRRKQAEDQLREAHERLAILHQLDDELSQKLDISYVLNIALDAAVHLSAADSGVIGLADDNGVRIVHGIGKYAQQIGGYMPLDSGIAARSIRLRQPELVTDVHADPDYVATIPETYAQMTLPLMAQQDFVGIISLETEHPEAFTPERFKFLQLVASRIAVAVRNAQLYKEAKEQQTLAEALQDTAAALNSTLDFDEVLQRILSNVGRVVPHDTANIMLIKNGRAHVARTQGYAPHEESTVAQISFVVIETATLRWMFERGQPLLIPDVHHFPGWESPIDSRIRAYLGIPITLAGACIGFLNLHSRTPDFFTPDHAERLRIFADQASIAIQNAHWFAQAKELAALQERQRLARDLHDAVSQTLFSANLITEMLLRQSDGHIPERIRQNLQQLYLLTRGAQAEMRTLLLELRPTTLVETPLAALLKHLTAAASSRIGIPVALHAEQSHDLPPKVQVAFYRIAQEALNNIVKYANATEVTVNLQAGPERVELLIEDNGRGFETEHIPPDHLGIRIMHERAKSIGAALTVKSKPGRGTQVSVSWEAES